MNRLTNAKLYDAGNFLIGCILFLSPWLFNYPAGMEPRSVNAFVVGIVIAVLSLAALAAIAVSEEWLNRLNLMVGFWLIVSPWILKFYGTTAMGVDVIIGLIVIAFAAFALWPTSQIPRRDAVNR